MTQKEEERQQKYLEFQLLQQQIEQLSQQLEMLNQQLGELGVAHEALNSLQKTPKDTEILTNVAPGIFVESTLKENQKLIVNVGAGVTIEKTVPQVVKMLELQKKELEENITQYDALLQKLAQQAVMIYQEFEAKEEEKN